MGRSDRFWRNVFWVVALSSLSAAHAAVEWSLLQPGGVRKLAVAQLCDDIAALYRKQKWGKSVCEQIPLQVMGWSVEGRPMVYFETGDPKSKKLTVIQCGIHGDELPALPMCLNLIAEIISDKRKIPVTTRLIVQPLLNPDGMLRAKAQRPNARGVDINRNFPTADWEAQGQQSWRKKDHGDPRKFPGDKAFSEPETRAISRFVENERPQKIISIHTPLGFLDLDSTGKEDRVRRARFLAINMSKNSGNYEFRRFGFYPGSLGNWAGQERQIPVYTLELPQGESSRTVDAYWVRFRKALWRAIDFDLDTGEFYED